jgi:hypothetical protein
MDLNKFYAPIFLILLIEFMLFIYFFVFIISEFIQDIKKRKSLPDWNSLGLKKRIKYIIWGTI